MIKRTPEGYLKNFEDWSEATANSIAQEENIELTPDHWEIIHFVRQYYSKNNTSPGIRALITALKPELGPEKANSLYLQKLFPKGAAKQATKLAGLPKPKKCI